MLLRILLVIEEITDDGRFAVQTDRFDIVAGIASSGIDAGAGIGITERSLASIGGEWIVYPVPWKNLGGGIKGASRNG